MPTFRRIRRTIAAVLLVLYLPACAQHVPPQYLTPGGITPQEYVATRHPKQVRLTLADSSSYILDQPWASHDTIGGLIAADMWNPGTPWAVAASSVRRLEVRQLADQPPELVPGQVVRITAPSLGVQGRRDRLVALRGDSLILREGAYPITAVTQMDVRVAHESSWLIGGAVGGLLGGIAGVAAGVAWCSELDQAESYSCTNAAGAGALVGGLGLLLGGALGAVVGGSFTHDTWEAVPPDQVRVGLRPLRVGVGFGASIAF